MCNGCQNIIYTEQQRNADPRKQKGSRRQEEMEGSTAYLEAENTVPKPLEDEKVYLNLQVLIQQTG
jgi:hypothetical protein